MKTVIIGKESNLSQQLAASLENTVTVSLRAILKDIHVLDICKEEPCNVIFNHFQPARQLNDFTQPSTYIERSLTATAKILEYLCDSGIDVNKIIYTSSSSVYGNNPFCNEMDETHPLNFHAALKISNELLISNFCRSRNIDYTITRVFNMYGGNDRFSIISKIISGVREHDVLKIINRGQAVRDFIHINDVVAAYKRLLNVNNTPIINIATGRGVTIASLLALCEDAGLSLELQYTEQEELKRSTADNTLLVSLMDKTDFIDVHTYLLEQVSQA